MKVIKYVSILFHSILPFLGFSICAFLMFGSLDAPLNIFVSFIILVIGFLISRNLFFLMKKRGVIEVMAGVSSSADLDNLEPVPGDGVCKIQSEELASLFFEGSLDFNGGAISIWGDHQGRLLEKDNVFRSIVYDSSRDVLTIIFTNSCLLKIKNPTTILYSTEYLKILNAKEILWKTPNDTGLENKYSYLNNGEIIVTKSNTNWKPHKYDLGLGQNAVYIQESHI